VKQGQITGISNNIFDLQRSINALTKSWPMRRHWC
jgi:hypothetical protein